MIEMLAQEAARKINNIFTQLCTMLHSGNETLRARVAELESQLKSVTEMFENARMWRENVLHGCPVLFEPSGLIYTLKPFGKLKRKPDKENGDVTGSPLTGVQSEHDAGKFPCDVS